VTSIFFIVQRSRSFPVVIPTVVMSVGVTRCPPTSDITPVVHFPRTKRNNFLCHFEIHAHKLR
jgi:hypothetical protein